MCQWRVVGAIYINRVILQKTTMKERILTGWTISRALYLVIGSYIVVQSLLDKQWVFVALGGYFAAMGLFAFGCAGGHCSANKYSEVLGKNRPTNFTEVEFEEVKAN